MTPSSEIEKLHAFYQVQGPACQEQSPGAPLIMHVSKVY